MHILCLFYNFSGKVCLFYSDLLLKVVLLTLSGSWDFCSYYLFLLVLSRYYFYGLDFICGLSEKF